VANSDNDIAGESGINRLGPDVGGHRNDVTAMVRLRYNFYSGGKDIANERSAAYKVSEAKEINYSAHRQVTESFGLAALEAMACGVPVISSNVGGIPEVNIDGETGYISEVGAVEEMAKNALGILSSEKDSNDADL